MNIRWQWCRLDDLSLQQVYAIFAAREAVFVVEQACAYQELDGLDAGAQHLVAWTGGEVAAYLRVLAAGVRFAEPSIGRVLTTVGFRHRGLGRELMTKALEQIDTLYAGQAVRISAQTYLETFYGALGFVPVSEYYLEDGIPHIEMLRQPKN
jgi:ElaA protein